MKVLRAADFLSDMEAQFEWYARHAGWDVAERFLDAVESSCRMLAAHPLIGPVGRFSHPRLQDWRFLLVQRPFNKHILFYEVVNNTVILRRAMHGHRNLHKRLLEPPTQES